MRIFKRLKNEERYGDAIVAWKSESMGKDWGFKGSLHVGIALLQFAITIAGGKIRRLILGWVAFPWRHVPKPSMQMWVARCTRFQCANGRIPGPHVHFKNKAYAIPEGKNGMSFAAFADITQEIARKVPRVFKIRII